MKSRVCYLLISVGLSTSIYAQDSKIPPMPDGPLLKRMPDFAAWNITEQGSPKSGAASVPGNSLDNNKVEVREKFIKTGSTIFEQSTSPEGRPQEIWHIGGIRVAKISGGSAPIICPDFGGGDIFSINFSSSDFAGLDWISRDSYSGIVKYQGKDCILFKSEVSPLSRDEQDALSARILSEKAEGLPVDQIIKVPAVAYVDLETRLPILAVFGGQKRSYQYDSPPAQKLSLPMELTGPLKAYLLRLRRVSAPPSRSY